MDGVAEINEEKNFEGLKGGPLQAEVDVRNEVLVLRLPQDNVAVVKFAGDGGEGGADGREHLEAVQFVDEGALAAEVRVGRVDLQQSPGRIWKEHVETFESRGMSVTSWISRGDLDQAYVHLPPRRRHRNGGRQKLDLHQARAQQGKIADENVKGGLLPDEENQINEEGRREFRQEEAEEKVS